MCRCVQCELRLSFWQWLQPVPLHYANRNQPHGWFGAGAYWTLDVHQRYVEAQGFNGA